MSTFCFVFILDGSGRDKAQSLMKLQSSPGNMSEFRTRAALVPYEVEDMWLSTPDAKDHTFIVYVEAEQKDMALEEFFNRVRPYKTTWSDWWNPLFQEITTNSLTKYLFTGQVGTMLLDSANHFPNIAAPSSQDNSVPPVSMRTFAYDQKSQEGQLLENMIAELGDSRAIVRQLMSWKKSSPRLSHISVMKTVKMPSLGESGPGDVILVVRLREWAADGRILADTAATGEEVPSLAAWSMKYGKLAELFMGRIFGDGQVVGNELTSVFEM